MVIRIPSSSRCRTVEYDEERSRIESGGSEFDVPIARKEPKQIDHAGTKTSKASSFSSKARAKAAARKSDLQSWTKRVENIKNRGYFAHYVLNIAHY